MKTWIISMGMVAAIGVAIHFIAAPESFWQFMSGYLFGAPLGALMIKGFQWSDERKAKSNPPARR